LASFILAEGVAPGNFSEFFGLRPLADKLGITQCQDLMRPNNLLIILLLTAGGVIVLAPLAMVLITSFTTAETVATGWHWPQVWTFANYRSAWAQGHFWRAFANSTGVALGVTAAQITTSSLAGYALARLQFPGRQTLLLLLIATLVIPFQLLVIPIFLVLKWGHLLNTYGALILPSAANGFGILLMRQHFLTLPPELEAAAALDGANRWQILWRVLLPLCRPALSTLFLFTFVGEWNDLFKPLVFTTRPELRTVQLTLTEFQEQYTNNWPLLMAAITIATMPVALLFSIGQKQLMRAIASTGIKG
jgi:multiple sugar transport system permease protein